MKREKNSSREEVIPCRILNQKQAMLLNVPMNVVPRSTVNTNGGADN